MQARRVHGRGLATFSMKLWVYALNTCRDLGPPIGVFGMLIRKRVWQERFLKVCQNHMPKHYNCEILFIYMSVKTMR